MNWKVWIYGLLLGLGTLAVGCGESGEGDGTMGEAFDAKLAAEISRRAAADAAAREAVQAANPVGRDSMQQRLAAVVDANCVWVSTHLGEAGFPGISEVGAVASHDFWVLAQRCEGEADLRWKMLLQMKALHRQGEVEPGDLAYLSDQVRIETGQRQRYGTQIIFDHTGQAVPLELAQPDSAEAMRARLGLDSLDRFLRRATELHRARNRAYYERLGGVPRE